MAEWWNSLSLAELDTAQWEALCDGCGRCCLHKLEDAENGELLYTRVHCRYLDADNSRCKDYANRARLVPDCVQLAPDNAAALSWLPSTCAYRLRANGKPLPAWHPLETGDPDSVHEAGISVRGQVISEDHVHPDGYDEHIITWIE